jgi:hypothetical protein
MARLLVSVATQCPALLVFGQAVVAVHEARHLAPRIEHGRQVGVVVDRAQEDFGLVEVVLHQLVLPGDQFHAGQEPEGPGDRGPIVEGAEFDQGLLAVASGCLGIAALPGDDDRAVARLCAKRALREVLRRVDCCQIQHRVEPAAPLMKRAAGGPERHEGVDQAEPERHIAPRDGPA